MAPTLNILIVDDDAEGSAALAKYMEARFAKFQKPKDSFNIGFLFARTLASGLAIAPQSHATILDIGLPDATVDEVIASIPRFMPPVVVYTASEDPAMTARCKTEGAVEVFLKGYHDGICRAVLGAMILSMAQITTEEAHGPAQGT